MRPLLQSREFLGELGGGEAGYPELFARIRRGGGHLHLRGLDTEKLGKNFRHGGVGFATLRRGDSLDLDAIAIAARDTIAAGAGDDFDVKDSYFFPS